MNFMYLYCISILNCIFCKHVICHLVELKMKKISILVLFIVTLLCISITFASTYTGKVGRLNVRDEDGLIWVWIAGERTDDRPTCATNTYMVIKNENSPAGKRQLAMLMLAKASNKTVLIEGARTCTRWGDGEDISVISVI